ncbi:hypothetical protein [Rhodoplanes roseus]|uniref:Uncharacterized protein n=1 Tax=Rhodoplanes roseus TaxID=29409 RepID=A0A327KQR9_9BRAD|nr:hypothetical protein [Rhodoplanes roseus]RAI40781.1 hypothetical protein CH341_23070 [Rhodoplanes roseus]
MTETGRTVLLTVLIGLLALPSGLCSAFFTVAGGAMLFEPDPLGRSISVVMLIGSGIGWIVCILVLLGARRLRRAGAAPPNAVPGPPDRQA